MAFAGGDHAGEGGGEFGSEGDVAAAFVGEAVELVHDLGAGFVLFGVELGGFEDGAVELDKAGSARDGAPASEQVVASGAVFGIEIPESGE